MSSTKLKLWLLRANPDSPHWKPWYDKAFGFVICAESEDAARQLAQENGGDETTNYKVTPPQSTDAWTNPEHSSCEELLPAQGPGVVLRDFAAA